MTFKILVFMSSLHDTYFRYCFSSMPKINIMFAFLVGHHDMFDCGLGLYFQVIISAVIVCMRLAIIIKLGVMCHVRICCSIT